MAESTIALRCYVESEQRASNKAYSKVDNVNPNNSLVLVFDTETTADEYQNLLFGSCGIWSNGTPERFILFYNEDILKPNDIQIIMNVASSLRNEVMTRSEFVANVFYPYVFAARAKCVCFNSPFDLSRLASSFTKSRKYRSGFSFKLDDNPKHPNIIVKSRSTKASFIEFTRPLRKKSEKRLPHYKGGFIDLRTLTFALTNNAYNLDKALKDFGCVLGKTKVEGHGKISEEYVEYNVNDTYATYELYSKATERYRLYGLTKEIHEIYSPASIGKAYLEKIGIKRLHEKNPDFPKNILGYLMSTYYGGRTEVRIRKQPVRVAYLDFVSMYPTIYALLGMDRFLKSKRESFSSSTEETRRFLNDISLEDIRRKETWSRLTTICRIIPDDDILPIRSKYENKKTYNIGINYLRSEDATALWYTLADLIASKLLTGKTPIIQEAITFIPEGMQEHLNEIEIMQGLSVKPDEDFIRRIIEERIPIKRESKKLADEDGRRQAALKQNILKIIANATSYGIFIEVNSDESADREKVKVHGLKSFETTTDRNERGGKAFNPVMATFITAGSRLLLAGAEALVLKNEGYVAYFDTDSTFVSPSHVPLVQEFFRELNPYAEQVETIKVEEDENGPFNDIWFYGISAKRYVLYELEKDNNIRIRKHSAHGLGHLRDIDEEKWWHDILTMHYGPSLKDQILTKYNGKVAFSQLTISNYEILKRFKELNENKQLTHQIKPFNFITVGMGYRIDPKTKEPIVPMLSFVNAKRSKEIPYMEFLDYKTGIQYPNSESLDTKSYWKPLTQVFQDYIDHEESKSEGQEGLLERKHIAINNDSVHYIGKETNEIDESESLGAFEDNYAKYDKASENKLKQIILAIKKPDASKYGLSERNLTYLKNKIRNNKPLRLKDRTFKRLMRLPTFS